MAYWSTAESIKRRSFRTRLAWARLRARRNPGTAIAANKAMIATTIMISTRVKPPRRLLILVNMLLLSFVWFDCVPHFRGLALFKAVLMPWIVVFRFSVLLSTPPPQAQVPRPVWAVAQESPILVLGTSAHPADPIR